MVKKKSKEVLVSEITDYILSNHGPDEDGRGHHKKKRLYASDLEDAIHHAEKQGLAKGLKPYHFKGTFGVWKSGEEVNEVYVNEVLVKKMDQLLEEQYKGDLLKMITNVNFEELNTSLIDTWDNRDIPVSVRRVMHSFDMTIFKIVKKYLELKELSEEFSELKPYHMARATKATYKKQDMVDEVIIKKIDSLLKEKYNNNLVELIKDIDWDKLKDPLIDYVNGKKIEVSMGGAMKRYDFSPFRIISRYIQVKGLKKEFWGIRPYHFSRVTQDTYCNEKISNEILVKKIDHLLEEKYKGDLINLIQNTTAIELKESFFEYLNDQKIEVSVMTAINTKNRGSPFQIISKYINLKGLKGYEELEPYHFSTTSQRTYTDDHDDEIVNGILTKKIDQLLKDKYNGDLSKLKENTSYTELMSPLIVELNGRDIEVSMHAVGKKFEQRIRVMIERYQEIKTSSIP